MTDLLRLLAIIPCYGDAYYSWKTYYKENFALYNLCKLISIPLETNDLSKF